MSLYKIINTTYKSILPKALRHKIYVLMPFKGLRSRLISVLEKLAPHDEIYDRRYYLEHEEPSIARSADVIADSIVKQFAPKCVIDVGCGTGLLLLCLRKKGVSSCCGIERSQAALDICRERGLHVVTFDLESDGELGLKADVAISTEVAEHLPKSCADRFVKTLSGIADTVILTASAPGSGGVDHVNEQPNEYWVEKFVSRNYRYLRELSMKWREQWKDDGVTICYTTSLMVFQREHDKGKENRRLDKLRGNRKS